MGTLPAVIGGLIAHWFSSLGLMPGLQNNPEGTGVTSAPAHPEQWMSCHPVTGPSTSTGAVVSLLHTPATLAALW